MAKIGTSLSSCLRSIHKGEVAIEDVQFITTSTAYASRDEMLKYLGQAMAGRAHDAHMANACTLWDSGRIFQPSVRPDGRYAPEIWIDAPTAFFQMRDAVA